MKYKNLNVFSKPITKTKLIKTVVGVTAPLILMTSLSGCFTSSDESYGYNNYVSGYNYTSSYYSYDYEKENYGSSTSKNNSSDNNVSSNYNNFNSSLALDEYLTAIINSNVLLDSNSLNSLINIINNRNVEFPYSNLYGTQALLNRYNSLPKYNSTSQNLFINRQITVDTLYAVIKNNNDNGNLSNNQKMNDSNLREICSIMVDVFNDYAKRHSDADLKLLSEKILELKIINFDGFSNGFYDNTLGKMGYSVSYLKNKSNEFFKETIEHETHHLIQAAGIKEISSSNYSNRMGMCYKFDDAEVNSLYWNWFYEGSAEYLTSDLNNTKTNNVYESLIRSIDAIKISTILNNNKVQDLENLTLSLNLNDLFKYFNCQSNEDKMEVINLMYAFELKYNFNSSCTDFFDKYESIYGKDVSKLELKRQLNSSIAQTLSKHFYKNLANSLKNKQVGIKEIFSIISVFENEISREILYNSNQNTLETFFDMYNELQSNLFEIVANKLGISVDDVQQAYNAYNKQTTVKLENTVLLDREKEEFFNYITETRKGHKMNSINYVSKKYNSTKKR